MLSTREENVEGDMTGSGRVTVHMRRVGGVNRSYDRPRRDSSTALPIPKSCSVFDWRPSSLIAEIAGR